MLHARTPILGAITVALLTLGTPSTANAATPPPSDRDAVRGQHLTSPATRVDKAASELAWQLRNGGIPLSAWEHVAQCETRGNWQDRGMFAGGLGIFTRGRFTPQHLKDGTAGTWERWGGEQFAPTPAKASITEQLVVANRIAIFGWSTTYTIPAGWKGEPMTFTFSRPGIGVTGWGCVKTHRWLKAKLCKAGTSNSAPWRRHCGRSS